ncbi:TonB-dependent receptor [Silvibacterium dinghuense]|nr:TonB-dependent receptor [Silvibacterium dinghuense]GGH15406.1 hypothetical protein GCM10011586_36460 [Silvibacterium dinghuense]
MGSRAFGQGVTGTIGGVVTDPSGAPVVGATVTVTDLETNAQHVITSSSTGNYRVADLRPGHYLVHVEAPGFQGFDENNLVLSIDQALEVNPSLKVGGAQEKVIVTAETPLLQSEQSSIGLTLDSNNIQNTPLNGRLSVLGLMILAPGVQNLSTAQDTVPATGVTLSLGTGRRNSYGGMATTLDGTINEEVSLQRSEAEIPSIDALQEFKLITNGAPAEFGQAGQIIVATKGGANRIHGELLEFNRSKGTSAKTYSFVTPEKTSARPPYERNEYGGNFSGPIFIPHLYDGRDRSFFFAAYERYAYTFSSSANTIQPTEDERNGDFSEFLAGGACNSTGTSVHIVNPMTGTDYYTANGNKIPSSDINQVSLKLLKLLYPTPTTSGCDTTNTYELIDYTQKAQRFSLRLDHKLSEKDQLRGTFMRAFYGPYPASWTDSLQGGYSADGEHNADTILGWTHTFSPTLVLDVPASYLHLIIVRQPHVNDVNFGSFISGLGSIEYGGAPTIAIKNLTSTGDSGGGHAGLEQDIEFQPTLTKVFSKHTIKTGFSWVWSNYYSGSIVSNGSFDFGNTTTYSGVPFADFLLGVPDKTVNGNPASYNIREKENQYAGFIQDDWKALPTLTLNYGLRYDLQWFQKDPYGRNSLYIPEQGKLVVFGDSIPASAVSSYVSSLESYGVIETSAQAKMSSNPWDYLGHPKNDFAPRLGFAWEATPKTVVRGAFGIYYNLVPTQYTNTEIDNLPFTATVTHTNSSTATSSGYFTMSDPFASTGAYSSNPSVGAQAKSKTPYTEQYNLAVERDLGDGFDLRVGYVGQHNLKQNNVQGPGTTTINLNVQQYPLINASPQKTYNVQPFSSITLNTIPVFHSDMNSLQVGLHKRYSHGLSVNAEYQWTRILGNENLLNPSGVNVNDSYGPASGTVPEVLNLNYTYELPFGHGHLIAGNARGVLNTIISGWQYSGVGTFQQGTYFTVTANTPSNTVGLTSTRANRVAGVPLYPKHKTNAEWFNPAAFSAPGSYASTDGNTYAAMGNSSYDMLRGPGWWNMDMNLMKNISWGERYNVQLRGDTFNSFNHPNFGVPASNISTPSSVGTITSTSSSPVYEQRTMEFGAKFTF